MPQYTVAQLAAALAALPNQTKLVLIDGYSSFDISERDIHIEIDAVNDCSECGGTVVDDVCVLCGYKQDRECEFCGGDHDLEDCEAGEIKRDGLTFYQHCRVCEDFSDSCVGH